MPISDRRAEQLALAMAEAKATKIRRDLLIAAALKSGASTREVSAVTGLSPVQVYNIGKANGWPTEAQQKVREGRQRERDEWREFINGAIDRYLDENDDQED